MYEVLISHNAEKYYKKVVKSTKKKINKCVEILIHNPIYGQHISRLHGELKGKYRYEIGDLRIVYEVNTKSKTVEIKSIKSRGDAYK